MWLLKRESCMFADPPVTESGIEKPPVSGSLPAPGISSTDPARAAKISEVMNTCEATARKLPLVCIFIFRSNRMT